MKLHELLRRRGRHAHVWLMSQSLHRQVFELVEVLVQSGDERFKLRHLGNNQRQRLELRSLLVAGRETLNSVDRLVSIVGGILLLSRLNNRFIDRSSRVLVLNNRLSHRSLGYGGSSLLRRCTLLHMCRSSSNRRGNAASILDCLTMEQVSIGLEVIDHFLLLRLDFFAIGPELGSSLSE